MSSLDHHAAVVPVQTEPSRHGDARCGRLVHECALQRRADRDEIVVEC
jgi:hypothetical protein